MLLYQEDIDVDMTLLSAVNIPIPTTYKQAIADPDRVGTQQSRRNLYHWPRTILGAKKYHTQDTNLVSTKWVFTTKTLPGGSMERYKASLVSRVFSQEHYVIFTTRSTSATSTLLRRRLGLGNLRCDSVVALRLLTKPITVSK